LTSLAGTMRRRGMGAEEIEAALLVTNSKRCDPPLGEDEVITIVASVCRYEPASEMIFR
jgi:putative DNA primase/helicase